MPLVEKGSGTPPSARAAPELAATFAADTVVSPLPGAIPPFSPSLGSSTRRAVVPTSPVHGDAALARTPAVPCHPRALEDTPDSAAASVAAVTLPLLLLLLLPPSATTFDVAPLISSLGMLTCLRGRGQLGAGEGCCNGKRQVTNRPAPDAEEPPAHEEGRQW